MTAKLYIEQFRVQLTGALNKDKFTVDYYHLTPEQLKEYLRLVTNEIYESHYTDKTVMPE